MFQADRAAHYEEAYTQLLARLNGMDLRWRAAALGADYTDGQLIIPSFARLYQCSSQGIVDGEGRVPPLTQRVVLVHYILRAGTAGLSGHWVSYRDFKDAAFFMAGFQQTVEEPLAAAFTGRLAALEVCSRRLDDREIPELGTGDLCRRYPALPNVPLALVFYDADEELPASAKVLYDAHSPFFLDLECLAVLGLILKDRLEEELDRLGEKQRI